MNWGLLTHLLIFIGFHWLAVNWGLLSHLLNDLSNLWLDTVILGLKRKWRELVAVDWNRRAGVVVFEIDVLCQVFVRGR